MTTSLRSSLIRFAAILVCIAALCLMSGCASTNTVLRIGLHADLTDKITGCDRKRDAGCGLQGPRDLAIIEVMYAPGIRVDRAITPYCSHIHESHYSAGAPANGKFEQVLDAPGCGGFIQFGKRK